MIQEIAFYFSRERKDLLAIKTEKEASSLGEIWDNYYEQRNLSYGFSRAIRDMAHCHDDWWTRYKLERTLAGFKEESDHFNSCDKCRVIIKNSQEALRLIIDAAI